MPQYPDSPLAARVARCCICRKVKQKIVLKGSTIVTIMKIIGFNKKVEGEPPPEEERAIYRCIECEPGSAQWIKYAKKYGLPNRYWKKSEVTYDPPVQQPQAKEKVRLTCRINKKGEAIFPSRIVKKEIERKFRSPSSAKATVTVVSTSTRKPSPCASTPTATTTPSSASSARRTQRATTTRSAKRATFRAGRS